jgi:MFS family permease
MSLIPLFHPPLMLLCRRTELSKKQLSLLFFCSVVSWAAGSGLTPLLPVYALKLGASQAVAGYYFSLAFAALAAGTFLGGWLVDKLQRRKLLMILFGAVVAPLLWAMGRANNVPQLTAATTASWFMLGMVGPPGLALAGLYAPQDRRGKIFGILGMSGGLGTFVGGLIVGPMVDRWGYPTMFTVLALFYLALPAGALFLEDKRIEQVPKASAPRRRESSRLGTAFFVLLLAHFAVIIVHGTGTMGRSLAMNALGLSAAALTGAVSVAGLVGLPFPFILGWLSDRLGRKRLMIVCYALYAIAMVVFAVSKSMWHFWVATMLMAVGQDSATVGTAFVTDLVPPEALGRGLSMFNGIFWVGMVAGLAVAGYAIQNLGVPAVMFISAALPLIGIFLVISIREVKPPVAVVTQ